MKYIKKNIKFIAFIVICFSISIISAHATTIVFNSRNVKYDNSTSHLSATNLQDAIDELHSKASTYTNYDTVLTSIENYKLTAHPVGSIYISTVDDTKEKVQNRFGGTWEAFSAGKTMFAINSGDSAFNSVSDTGGAKTHTISVENLPSHTHTYSKPNSSTEGYALKLADITNHNHGFDGFGMDTRGEGSVYFNLQADQNFVLYRASDNKAIWSTHTSNSSATGVDGLYTVTLGTGTTTTTSVGSGTAHSHTVSTSTADTTTTGSGTALSTKDPYVVVYMWKRTA